MISFVVLMDKPRERYVSVLTKLVGYYSVEILDFLNAAHEVSFHKLLLPFVASITS